MPARRYRALHFGDMDGKNVVYHREHRSKRGRAKRYRKGMRPAQPRNSKRGSDWESSAFGKWKPQV